jgi:hypothetical protein
MSTGRIMTLSVESLNKLYFQFIEQFISPRFDKPLPEISQLLKQRRTFQMTVLGWQISLIRNNDDKRKRGSEDLPSCLIGIACAELTGVNLS